LRASPITRHAAGEFSVSKEIEELEENGFGIRLPIIIVAGRTEVKFESSAIQIAARGICLQPTTTELLASAVRCISRK
jgi:DNA-binding NarL/FixJ family response regulator